MNTGSANASFRGRSMQRCAWPRLDTVTAIRQGLYFVVYTISMLVALSITSLLIAFIDMRRDSRKEAMGA